MVIIALALISLCVSVGTVNSADGPNRKWEKTFGGNDRDTPSQIIQTKDGGYLVIGDTESFGAGKEDFWALKLNSEGSIEWNKTYGGEGYDEPGYIIETDDGGYAIVGHTTSYTNGRKGWLGCENRF